MADKQESEAKTAASLVKKGSAVAYMQNDAPVSKLEVWAMNAPAVKDNPDLMFALCSVEPSSTASKLMLKQKEPPSDQVFEASANQVFNANTNLDPMAYNDVGTIPHQNIPCVLEFLRVRYMNKVMYTAVEPLIVAINPFQDLHNGTPEVIGQYRDAADCDKLPPHIFQISRRAVENLHGVKKSQTIVVSGESGAGKTETTKQLMKYFASARSGNLDARIQQAIMAANPVLEAFGNAKTVRNNNSSRFGRFMQLDVAKGGGIRHGSVLAFLLEKSRILTQDQNERSYHIFYQMIKGSTPQMRERYKLLDCSKYQFLNPHCVDAPGVDDLSEFESVVKAFESMGLKEEQRHTIWSVVSGVLLLGNVATVGKKEGGVENAAVITGESARVLKDACDLLFLDSERVLTELTVKVTYAGNNKIEGRWTVEDSDMLRGSLAKAVYEKLFLWIIQALNSTIEPPGGFQTFMALNSTIEPPGGFQTFMGLLDIFGFEVFQNNSLEQLFINITNEMLQSTFTEVVFARESALYKSEGITAKDIEFTTNNEVISVLIDKGNSILSILEDQCLAPGFIFKNKDVLRPEMVEVVQASGNPVVRALFEGVKVERGKMAKGSLIGSQFLGQLSKLMSLIGSTEAHFIRCVKPNEEKKPLLWVQSKVLIQLHALSIIEALQLRQLGYSYRRQFQEFVEQFQFIDLSAAKMADKRAATEAIIASANLQSGAYALGKTMVFLKPESAKYLVHLQRTRLSAWGPLIGVIEAIYVQKKLHTKKQAFAICSRICAHARRKLDQHI
ncbi:myosin A, putative [Eimeria praecox]|uniref:Myosin A, putative n=1 Tax=Eimeria praecox TaxID=51316 RepID=U6H424_9EIME|nr:myosin A, putative [Eimeria praecox]